MFSYRCLDCGKKNSYSTPFRAGMEVSCLRCGQSFSPAREMIQETMEVTLSPVDSEKKEKVSTGLTTRTKPEKESASSSAGKQNAKAMSSTAIQALNETKTDSPPISSKKNPTTAKAAQKLAPDEEIDSDDDIEMDDESDLDDDFPESEEVDQPKAKKEKSKKTKKKPGFSLKNIPRSLLLGVPVAMSLLLGGGYWMMTGTPVKKPLPPKPAVPVEQKQIAENQPENKKTNPEAVPPEQPSGTSQPENTTTKNAPSNKPENVQPQISTEKKTENVQLVTPYARISAVRLGSEVAKNVSLSDSRYSGKILEVSGMIGQLDLPKIAPPPPPVGDGQPNPATPAPAPAKPPEPLFVLLTFETDTKPIISKFDVPNPGALEDWNLVNRSQPVTLRGRYDKGGKLIDCALVAPKPPADAIYKGKLVELSGEVIRVAANLEEGGEFPLIRLRGEEENRTDVVFLFKKDDRDKITGIKVRDQIAIQGKCEGRVFDGERWRMRFHNCQVVTTTAPEVDEIVRVDYIDFLRSYEEDMRAEFVPARGQEERVKEYYSVDQLGKKLSNDPKSLLPFHNKMITVTGRVGSRSGNRVTLESADTDQPLKVVCRFDTYKIPDFLELADVQIQGLCRAKNASREIQLIHSQANPAMGIKVIPRLAADFLPHDVGKTQVYDVVSYYKPGQGTIVRQMHYPIKGSMTETYTTNMAIVKLKSLFDRTHYDTWVNDPKTSKGNLKGPVYSQFEKDGKIYLGPVNLQQDQNLGAANIQVANKSHEPVIKIDAKVGDSWKEVINNVKHEYFVDRFDVWRGLESVVINEIVISPVSTDLPREIRHVYVRGLGEVERQEWLRKNPNEKVLIAEKKWIFVEDLPIYPVDDGSNNNTDKKPANKNVTR